MAVKTKPRPKRRQPSGRAVFPRRLSWREVESAFDHFFDVGLRDQTAERIILRFRRARSQLLPLFSSMVVSPYERERLIALELLERMGGRATLQMVEELLGDHDVYEAFKFDLRHLRETLAARVGSQPDDDEDEERDDADGESTATAESSEDERKPKAGRARRRRGRGSASDEDGEPELTVSTRPLPQALPDNAPLDATFFARPSDSFMARLDAEPEAVLSAFAALPDKKQVSFIDRLAAVREPNVWRFLVLQLESGDVAVIQSALKGLERQLERECIPFVEALLERGPARTVKQRATRLLAQLQAEPPEPADEAADATEAGPAAEGESATSGKPAPKPRSRRGRGGRPAPLPKEAAAAEPVEAPVEEPATEPETPREQRRDGRREQRRDRDRGRRRGPAPLAELAAAAAEPELGLAEYPAPTPRTGEPLAVEGRLPVLLGCVAGGVGIDGRQELAIFRAGPDDTVARVDLTVGDDGWWSVCYTTGAPKDSLPNDAGWAKVTASYVRQRLQQAAVVNAQQARALPSYASAALAFVGSGKKVETEEELPSEPQPLTQGAVEALLEHPLMADWRITFRPRSGAVARWLATRGRRIASRLRKQLIDEVIDGWLATNSLADVILRLRRQAHLLDRAGEPLAATALALAAELTAGRTRDSLLLRELAYRGFVRGVDFERQQSREQQRESWVKVQRARRAQQNGLAARPAPRKPRRR